MSCTRPDGSWALNCGSTAPVAAFSLTTPRLGTPLTLRKLPATNSHPARASSAHTGPSTTGRNAATAPVLALNAIRFERTNVLVRATLATRWKFPPT
jgi:hypothetical protein